MPECHDDVNAKIVEMVKRWPLLAEYSGLSSGPNPSRQPSSKQDSTEGFSATPRKCDHLKARFTGDIWFCMECGEPVRDRDERRQATLDEAFTW